MMELRIEYPNGGAFSIAAKDADDFETLYALAIKTLWGERAKVMTLAEADKWLGWDSK